MANRTKMPSSKKRKKRPSAVRKILLLGTFLAHFLSRCPSHAQYAQLRREREPERTVHEADSTIIVVAGS